MKNLQVRGIKTIPSYEVAEMMGRAHKEVLKMLEGQKSSDGSTKHVGIIQVISESGELHLSDYFIESSYKVPGNNRTYKCYECTKMGCDILANKMTGEKGTIFTAKYVAKFNAMEQQLKYSTMDSYMIEDPIARAKRWIEEQEEKQLLENKVEEMQPRIDYLEKIQGYGVKITTSQIAVDYGMSATAFNKLLKELHIQYKQGGVWYLYQNYKGKGYEVMSTYNGHLTRYWTPQGAEWLYHILKEYGYVPVVESNLEIK